MDDEKKMTASKGSHVKLKTWVIIFVNITAILFSAVVIYVAYGSGDLEIFRRNVLICVLGALVGWLAGTLVSPYTKTESTTFLSIGQAISAFVSGYLISKVDRFIERALFTTEGIPEYETWERAGLFVASFLIWSLIVFVNRTYFFQARVGRVMRKTYKRA